MQFLVDSGCSEGQSVLLSAKMLLKMPVCVSPHGLLGEAQLEEEGVLTSIQHSPYLYSPKAVEAQSGAFVRFSHLVKDTQGSDRGVFVTATLPSGRLTSSSEGRARGSAGSGIMSSRRLQHSRSPAVELASLPGRYSGQWSCAS